MTLLRVKEKAACNVRRCELKACLHRCQPAEKTPRQSRVIDQDNPPSFGNHERYIANRSGFDNEPAVTKKGPRAAPWRNPDRRSYFPAASAASGPPAPWASEIRAFLPRSPRR